MLRDIACVAAATLALVLLLEGGTRAILRIREGSWPSTEMARFDRDVRNALRLYRRHPFLNAAPAEGVSVRAFGKQASFNSLGYRSPERSRAKPDGTTRILCSGGSTTFDILAARDEESWPWLLEERLASEVPGVEVWNAGFPSWTSAENLIALSLRDLELAPDVVVLFQGINDLQPAGHVPFDPSYEHGHADQAVRALGFGLRRLPLYERSLFFEWVRDATLGPREPYRQLQTVPPAARQPRLPENAVATFERNLRSYLSVAMCHGARVVLVTQPVRIRGATSDADLAYLAQWIGGIEPTAVPGELERLNDVARGLAEVPGVLVLDVAAEAGWTDRDFADPMHFSAPGSARMADTVAVALIELLAGL